MNKIKSPIIPFNKGDEHKENKSAGQQSGFSPLGFTLVELIVVITILAILATVGFVSFSGYLAGTRDTNRIAQLKSMSDALELYRTKKYLPLPDDKVDIKTTSKTIAYQGYIGKNVLETIEYTESGLDPKDKNYFSYYLTKNKKYFQLLAFLEEPSEDVVALNKKRPVLGTKNIALKTSLRKVEATDYSERYPKTTGKKLGILTDENNTPIQEIPAIISSGSLDIDNVGNLELKLNLKNGKYVSGSGTTFIGVKELLLEGGKGYSLLKNSNFIKYEVLDRECPEGFIKVPGNSEFNTNNFCVAKYEMTYSDADIPNSSETSNSYNIVKYESSKIPVSMAGKFPIGYITQKEAIESCKKIGFGYHLITNDEWMTIARNIESNKNNWSNGIVSDNNGYIYRGNGLKGGCQDHTGTRDLATKTGPTGNTICNKKRQLELTNGEIIWDLSGNISEFVNKNNTYDGVNYNIGDVFFGVGSGLKNWDSISEEYVKKYGPSTLISSDYGMGVINENKSSNGVFFRGGSYSSGISIGIFMLYPNALFNIKDNGIGFRCTR